MSGTKSKLKREVERSMLDSKEEAKLDTTYDKIVYRVSGLMRSMGLNFVAEHRDYNSEKGAPKLIKVTNSAGDLTIAEFTLNESIESNFLNADKPRFAMNLVEKDDNYPLTLQKFAQDLGKILNVDVKVVKDLSMDKSVYRKA